ncbi:hypothetical protein [Pseudoalteromonas sp. McH1-42]|nr:hypothetical protein [Pseudoalteromonas sp. McH1-42]MCG7561166.1 hypothetical protein [Pseudoalteromonas sp. McH1-42]
MPVLTTQGKRHLCVASVATDSFDSKRTDNHSDQQSNTMLLIEAYRSSR